MERPDIETGTVLKTEGDWATVMTNKSKSCNECGKAQAGICGKSGAGMLIKARNSVSAKVWDTVLLELDRKTHVKAYFYAFVLPVILMFGGTYTGHLISDHLGIRGLDVVAGFTCLFISIVYAMKKIRSLDRTNHFQISRVISEGHASDYLAFPEEEDYLAIYGRNN